MKDDFKIRFWGVRGSYPVPGSDTVRFGGNTACVEVRAGGHLIILDAGTGIIRLGKELARNQETKATLLLSHLHHDHTQGFPFFVPAYLSSVKLYIFGPEGVENALKKVMDSNQTAQTFPVSLQEMSATKEIRSLRDADQIVLDSKGIRIQAADSSNTGAVVIKVHHTDDHPGGINYYRIEYRGLALVYATDTEGYVGGNRNLADFARGADVLIHDAQYSREHYYGEAEGLPSTQGYGHSTTEMACELAANAGVNELILFHHDPNYDDQAVDNLERKARALFPRARAAYEDLSVNIGTGNE